MSASAETIEAAFRTYRPSLMSYLFRMTASEEDTEDLLSQTFEKVVLKFESFRDESSLKTWVFAIATNLARDHLRSRRRWRVDAQDTAKRKASAMNILEDLRDHQRVNPEVRFEISEHIDFCFTCMMKTLPLDQHVVLMLIDIYQFKIREVASIVDRSESAVKHLLRQARGSLAEIFEHRCALVSGTGVCYQCTELNGIFNPKQNNHEELSKLKMVQAARTDSANQAKLLNLRLKLIREIDPYSGKRARLHLSHMRMLQSANED